MSRVGIVGAGAAAHAAAALLAGLGHEPSLWSPSGKGAAALLEARGVFTAKGVIEGEVRVAVARDAREAVDGAELVLFALPLNGHRAVMEAVAPHVAPGQALAISSHGSFSALYLSRLLVERGVAAPIVAFGSTLTRSRITGPARIKVATVRKRVDAAVLPARAAGAAQQAAEAIFGPRFVWRESLLAVALSNINAQGHLALGLLNLTRMEKGESWEQMAHLTPAVGRLLEALDAERMAIAAAFGVEVKTLRAHYAQTYDLPESPLAETAATLAARPGGTLGPKTLDTRYITEDAPYGLWPMIELGRLCGVPTPLHQAGLTLLSAAHGRDFPAENELLPRLGFAAMTSAELARLCEVG